MNESNSDEPRTSHADVVPDAGSLRHSARCGARASATTRSSTAGGRAAAARRRAQLHLHVGVARRPDHPAARRRGCPAGAVLGLSAAARDRDGRRRRRVDAAGRESHAALRERPAVLGIDIEIFPHTTRPFPSIRPRPGSSCSRRTRARRRPKMRPAGSLRGPNAPSCPRQQPHPRSRAGGAALAGAVAAGRGLVLVADTLVEEFPAGYYANRPWDRGNNPRQQSVASCPSGSTSPSPTTGRDARWSPSSATACSGRFAEHEEALSAVS